MYRVSIGNIPCSNVPVNIELYETHQSFMKRSGSVGKITVGPTRVAYFCFQLSYVMRSCQGAQPWQFFSHLCHCNKWNIATTSLGNFERSQFPNLGWLLLSSLLLLLLLFLFVTKHLQRCFQRVMISLKSIIQLLEFPYNHPLDLYWCHYMHSQDIFTHHFPAGEFPVSSEIRMSYFRPPAPRCWQVK